MFRLHGLLVTSRPLVSTQPSRCSKKHRALYAYRRAGAGGISLSADACRDTPRVAARCVLVFCPRSLRRLYVRFPARKPCSRWSPAFPPKTCSTRSLSARLFRGKLFSFLPVPGLALQSGSLIGTSCLLGQKTRRRRPGQPVTDSSPTKGRTHHHGTQLRCTGNG